MKVLEKGTHSLPQPPCSKLKHARTPPLQFASVDNRSMYVNQAERMNHIDTLI